MRVLLRSAPRNGAPSAFHARLRGGAVSDCFFHARGSSFEVRAGSPRLPTLPYYSIRISFIQGVQGDQGYQAYRVAYPSHSGRADRQGKGRRNRETESLRETTSSRFLALEGRHHPQGRSLAASAGWLGPRTLGPSSTLPRCHAKDSPPLKCRLECRLECRTGLGVHPLLHFDRTQDRNCLLSPRDGSVSACLAEESPPTVGITVRQHTRTSSPPRQLASLATSLSVTRIHHCPVLVQSSPAIRYILQRQTGGEAICLCPQRRISTAAL